MKIIAVEGLDGSPVGFCGVYAIRNKENERVYIGSSSNVADRWSAHKHFLKGLGRSRSTHKNRHLQHDWNEYGKDAFELILLENAEKDSLVEKEQQWIDHFGLDDLYNVTYAHRDYLSKEMCINIAEAQKGKTLTKEHRQALSESHMGTVWSDKRRAAQKPGVQDKSLSFTKATAIREAKAAGETYKSLASKYGVSERTIYDVVANNWYHDPSYQSPVKKKTVIDADLMEKVIARAMNGEKVIDLADEYSINKHAIYRRLRKIRQGETI